MLPLTKTLHPSDYDLLAPELEIVGAGLPAGQASEHRIWEYCMALRAVNIWMETHHGLISWPKDIGGAGSPFGGLLHQVTGAPITVVDPTMNMTLAEYVHSGPNLGDIVTCLSVIEHVDDLDEFLYHLACLVAPGGLLFLTMDCWDKTGPDTAHFHWLRKRIFSMFDLTMMIGDIQDDQWFPNFNCLGGVDRAPNSAAIAYHGSYLYGTYTFASLALVKRS